ncbi:MAG: hypothetical protein ACLR5Y_00290 [Haemophilus parainfluenzae]
MRFTTLLLSLTLFGCSFGVSASATPLSLALHNEKHYFRTQIHVLTKYLARRKKDMKDCGMDFVTGESDDPEVNLCLEKKGWYLKGGPVCENILMWDSPICTQWRKKHSKPDAKPWK